MSLEIQETHGKPRSSTTQMTVPQPRSSTIGDPEETNRRATETLSMLDCLSHQCSS